MTIVFEFQLLEDLIKTHNDMTEYYRIPLLGQHYTQRWAKEDLENERLKSAGEAASVEKSSDEGGKMLKKAETVCDEVAPYGELTQRLVGGLMEENIMTSVEESIEASSKKGGSSDSSVDDAGKANLIRSLNINNPEALEARVRKELEEQGIINPGDDDDDDVDNDEILEELKRCQNELKAVSSHNVHQLKRLLQAAKEEMVRQELRNKLQKADQEVMDAYQKISSARSKKKAPSKKEREQAWKTLKEREVILKELESV
jgi:transcriptional adapter 3